MPVGCGIEATVRLPSVASRQPASPCGMSRYRLLDAQRTFADHTKEGHAAASRLGKGGTVVGFGVLPGERRFAALREPQEIVLILRSHLPEHRRSLTLVTEREPRGPPRWWLPSTAPHLTRRVPATSRTPKAVSPCHQPLWSVHLAVIRSGERQLLVPSLTSPTRCGRGRQARESILRGRRPRRRRPSPCPSC